jgi:Zn-dependent peptidase ImmA (M78 family)
VAEKLGIELRFVDIPSMEGMYVRASTDDSQPIILVSALRPAGRQAMTAAHELGHHVFGHGTRIDEYIGTMDENREPSLALEPEEMAANTFAAFFLMPKAAVDRAFAIRGWTATAAQPQQVFSIAGWLGVGYASLIHHMRLSLGMFSKAQAKELLSVQPKRIRQQILGTATFSDCFLLDHPWTGRPLDMQVGDVALVDSHTTSEGACLDFADSAPNGLRIVAAIAPGLGRIVAPSWAAFVRVRRRDFVGRSIFRHIDSAGDDDA